MACDKNCHQWLVAQGDHSIPWANDDLSSYKHIRIIFQDLSSYFPPWLINPYEDPRYISHIFPKKISSHISTEKN